ncbi:MAG TPA: phenylalanine--tRNA ligase subunit beta, partial [Candidatus Competibacteraceae bacterium]|nr:phenylalanine--tRNA ligase subunit beta [Candidatus Competibacteraceae bacterium]
MRISEQWLREWVDPAVDSARLAAQLTMAGLEVDAVEPAAPAFSNVVVGKVIGLVPHPDAERLRVATVDVGQGEPLQIVCGAPNVAVGMCAPTALVGAVLPGELKIKRSKLRGVESAGMLCSAKELGLSEDAAGLMALPADSVPGTDVRELLGLEDSIIVVDLTPNRGDCLGMAGIAREVAVLNRCPLRELEIAPVAPASDDRLPVVLEDGAGCPRYVGRVVRGVDVHAETPLWMKERLRRAGVRSLGPLVDVTNYVMLELGQPMHAFDLARLNGGIVVRRARAGETLELLNGNTVALDGETLVIADHAGAVAMAGIMGGEHTACGDDTRDVFLESAFFSPLTIAGRARRYGLHTDSSHRFERGVDPELQVKAMERATRLLLDIAGGRPGPVIEAVAAEHLPVPPSIRLRPARIRLLLGRDYAAAQVEDILSRQGMTLQRDGDAWQVLPPARRFDIAIEADLIEEIARVDGYDNVPVSQPLTRLTMQPQPEAEVPLSRLRETLIQRGYQEAITYSFVDPRFQRLLDPEAETLALANPISADLAVMRTSLWPGLVKALVYNLARQQTRVRLFESGLTFRQEDGALRQRPYIGGVVCGPALPEQWGTATRGVDFYDLKADVEALLALTGEPERFAFVAARPAHPALHPGQCARIERNGMAIGWIGALHPAMERELELDSRVLVFELDLDALRRARL